MGEKILHLSVIQLNDTAFLPLKGDVTKRQLDDGQVSKGLFNKQWNQFKFIHIK